MTEELLNIFDENRKLPLEDKINRTIDSFENMFSLFLDVINRIDNKFQEQIDSLETRFSTYEKEVTKNHIKPITSPPTSTPKFDSPIGGKVAKLQEPREKLLKWYELHSVKSDQPSNSNSKIEKERKKTSDPAFKIIVFGKPEKTAFIQMFLTGFFAEGIRNTIGVDFSYKTVEVEGKKIKLQIWDFAAEERFRTLLPPYITGSDGAIVMYDIIDAKTLKAISEDIELVKKNVGNIPIFLNVPELPSKADEFADFLKKYTLTEITSDIGRIGENIFRLLVKKMLEHEQIE